MFARYSLAFTLVLAACGGPARADGNFVSHPANRSASVEYFTRQPLGSGPWPTIVFLHGHQNGVSTPGGQTFSDWGVLDRYASQGYLAVSVSLPGYGGSDGPADFAGPYTQDAVAAVLTKLEADGLADPNRVLLQGVSLGAVTAGLIAAGDPGIDGIVLISGLYDLPAFLNRRASPGAAAVRAAAMQQVGGDIDALTSRSVLRQASGIRAPALILNGAKDDRTDPDQARNLAEVLKAQGVTAKVIIYEEHGHEIPVAVRQAEIDLFIERYLPARF